LVTSIGFFFELFISKSLYSIRVSAAKDALEKVILASTGASEKRLVMLDQDVSTRLFELAFRLIFSFIL
jgi:hypothetical protein